MFCRQGDSQSSVSEKLRFGQSWLWSLLCFRPGLWDFTWLCRVWGLVPGYQTLWPWTGLTVSCTEALPEMKQPWADGLEHKFTPQGASFLQGSLNRQDWKMSMFPGLLTRDVGSQHLLGRWLCRWVVFGKSTPTPSCARTEAWAAMKVVALWEGENSSLWLTAGFSWMMGCVQRPCSKAFVQSLHQDFFLVLDPTLQRLVSKNTPAG